MPDTRAAIEDIQAWITIENRELPIYGVQLNGTVATCWIASEEGKHFTVNFQRTRKGKKSVRARIFLDGWAAGGKDVRLEVTRREYVRLSSTQVKNFCFGKLNLTDLDVAEPAHRKELGDIRIRFDKGAYSTKTSRAAARSIPEVEAVNERSKKALTHQVEYGASRVVERRGRSSFFRAAEGTYTPYTIVFKYRPLAMLQAMAIAPLPSPRPSPKLPQQVAIANAERSAVKKRNYSLVNADEDEDNKQAALESVEKKLLAELEVIRKLKKPRGNATIKAEQLSTSLSGEVIDLT